LKLNRKSSNQFYFSALTLFKLFFGVANDFFSKKLKVLPKRFSPSMVIYNQFGRKKSSNLEIKRKTQTQLFSKKWVLHRQEN
jgi:hypothetical protein